MALGSSSPKAPWRIGVDVGGTFTDLVLADDDGATWVAKVPSVPSDPSQGVLAAIDRLAADLGTTAQAVLEGCALFVHGSTVATNTLLEGKGARVGLLTTEGFRDALEIRRGLRENQWDHRAPYPPVLVPRYLRLPVGGRLTADGTEETPVRLADVAAAVDTFKDEGVEAVAVSLFNSFVDDSHERAVVEELQRLDASPWVTASSAVAPVMGEYERTSTAVINAALAPKIVSYLRALDTELRNRGLQRSLLLVQSNGGVASVEQLAPRPVNLLLSGPAAGVGALNLYRQYAGSDDLISMEIGGTSCDVLLMSAATVDTKDELMIGGYHVATPSIDIHTIGAGGGTIAGVDSGGMLFVGPKGAGAVPGPACYGFGGTDPTVTDAQLVLGRLRPGPYAGGAITLDLDAAREAIRTKVAEPLGIDIESAAAGIIALVEQHLLHAVEYLSIERGHSPKRFTFVAAGGAGPMHGSTVGRALGCTTVYVPRQAGAFCALGMLHADIRQDFQRFLLAPLAGPGAVELATVDTMFAGLDAQATEALTNEGVDLAVATLERSLDLRYAGQLWSIRVVVPSGPFDVAVAKAAFETEYARLYGHTQPNGTIMISSLRVTGRASTGRLNPPAPAPMGTAPQPIETRKVWHGTHGWLDTDVYAGADLRPGQRLYGPIIVEEATTTMLVGPGDVASVDPSGNFVIDLPTTGEPTSAAQAVKERDPIVLALMQHRLDQISKHMGWVMTRTASSPIFSQSHDFSCFVTAPDGTLVANADGIPIHTGGGGFAARALLKAWEGRINPGDVFLLSDPYTAGGNHLPDWVLTQPVFVDAGDGQPPRLAGLCCNRAHQSDIGGNLAGTYNPEATEIWQEGIRLPVMKLFDRGELRDDLWQLLLLNSRTADLLDGDLRAMLGSTQIGVERVTSLVNELGLDAYLDYLAGICDHADRRFREAVAELPDGRYEAVEHTDNDCFGPADVDIKVALTVTGDSLTIDFTGSSDQIRGFKNSSLANTYSAAYMALSSFFDPDLPRNEGTYRCVEIIAPEGSITNARPPAPMTMNTVFVAWEIVHAVWKALSLAAPDQACAGWGKTLHGHVAGTRPDGRTWVMYQWHAMGTPGATSNRDGFPQMGHLISLGGLDLPNLEFHEQQYPVRYRRWELRADASGPGAYRGGTGVIYEADILAPAIWSFRAEGLDTPTGYGVLGGGDGKVGEEWVTPADTARDGDMFIPPKYGVRRIGPGKMLAWTPGGGGWGDPLTRDPQLVLRDVRDGVVSVDVALADYGVVLTADERSVDTDATAAARGRR